MASMTFTIERRTVLVASDGRVFADVASAFNAYHEATPDPMQHLLNAVEHVCDTRDAMNDVMGKRVAVYWTGDEREFIGTVTRVDASTKSVFVTYDDGDESWENSWRVLETCTRTPGCPKHASHRGPCPGKKRIEKRCTTRPRVSIRRLGCADGWGHGPARRWTSAHK